VASRSSRCLLPPYDPFDRIRHPGKERWRDTTSCCRWHTDRVAVEGRAERGQTLGSFIRTQRRLAALSLRQLAGMTSVSNAYLSQIERGIHQPSLRVLHSLAQALDVPTTVLLEHAGMESIDDERVDAPLPTAAAIQLDPELTEADRKLLLALYERLRGSSR